MRGYRIALVCSLVLTCASIAFGAWAWRQREGESAHGPYAERLARFETLLHRLHEQALRAHANLAGSYDPIVQTTHELIDVRAGAHEIPAYVPASSRAQIESALASIEEVLDVELDLVERFKTEHAVLLNSLRYFPVGAGEGASEAVGAAGLASPRELGDLVRDVLRVSVSPTDEARADVARHLAALRAGALDETTARLLRHAEVITERRAEVDRLLREILEQPDTERARALTRAYAEAHDLAQANDRDRGVAFFVLALFVVVSISLTIILRLQASAEEIAEKSRLLAQAVEAQNRFVSMTSHEFRTPLSVIVSSADLLAAYSDRWSSENRHKHLKRIDRAARGMTDLLDGLLLIGRSDAGHSEYRPHDADIETIVTESVEAQRLRAKDGIRIELAARCTERRVRFDTRLFRHVVDNLVGNGVKYGKPGGTVHVELACDGREARLEVRDDGIGIPPDHLSRLFDTFARARNVGAIPGTGLGLAIVKRAVDQHHGQIEASSELGVGTKFVVRFPVEPPQADLDEPPMTASGA
ncbi:MAG: DAHL domain-containing protein [Sandaracinus sp.]